MTAILILDKISKDNDGFPVSESTRIEVYAEEKSITRAEFYESMRAGVSVKTVLEVRQEDFEEAKQIVDGKKEYARKIEYDGEEYEIKRTYRTGKSKIELICG